MEIVPNLSLSLSLSLSHRDAPAAAAVTPQDFPGHLLKVSSVSASSRPGSRARGPATRVTCHGNQDSPLA